jgi:hypothetical protein
MRFGEAVMKQESMKEGEEGAAFMGSWLPAFQLHFRIFSVPLRLRVSGCIVTRQ